MSKRKPHSGNAGYISERKVQDHVGGHIVIYDTQNGFDLDGEERWIVMHEPSTYHVSVSSLKKAYEVMRDAAIYPAYALGVEDEDFIRDGI